MTSYFCNVSRTRGKNSRVRGIEPQEGGCTKKEKPRHRASCATREMPRTITYPISNIIFLLAVKSNQRRRCLAARRVDQPCCAPFSSSPFPPSSSVPLPLLAFAFPRGTKAPGICGETGKNHEGETTPDRGNEKGKLVRWDARRAWTEGGEG